MMDTEGDINYYSGIHIQSEISQCFLYVRIIATLPKPSIVPSGPTQTFVSY